MGAHRYILKFIGGTRGVFDINVNYYTGGWQGSFACEILLVISESGRSHLCKMCYNGENFQARNVFET